MAARAGMTGGCGETRGCRRVSCLPGSFAGRGRIGLAWTPVLAHMRHMTVPPTRTIALATALAAGLAVAIAQIAEHWLEPRPARCAWWERWPYRVVILLGLDRGGAAAPVRAARIVLWVAVLVALVEVALGDTASRGRAAPLAQSAA